MQSFFVSTLVVALAEIGDKTQLLALVLATRFRRPIPIILGILVATLANHAGAAVMGLWISRLLPPGILRWVMGLSFLAFAFWTLIPDKLDNEGQQRHRYGPFLTTLVAFFLVEIGDKTQVATVALAARFSGIASVVMGTTLGMLLANIPVVLFGHVAADRIPVNIVRYVTAAVFTLLGILAVFDPKIDLW